MRQTLLPVEIWRPFPECLEVGRAEGENHLLVGAVFTSQERQRFLLGEFIAVHVEQAGVLSILRKCEIPDAPRQALEGLHATCLVRLRRAINFDTDGHLFLQLHGGVKQLTTENSFLVASHAPRENPKPGFVLLSAKTASSEGHDPADD